MTQWIYMAKKVDIDQVENSLADLGEAGWEAFSAYPHPNNSMWMIVTLKKPKDEVVNGQGKSADL